MSMKAITLRAKADAGGMLKLELPTGTADTEYELVVVLQPTDVREETKNGDPIPLLGTAARLAYEAERANIHLGNQVDASRSDEILQDEFADYLLNRMQNDDASE